MIIEYDKIADAAYIYIQYPIKDGEARRQLNVNESIILDFDKKGRLLGVEILDASKLLNKKVLMKAKKIEENRNVYKFLLFSEKYGGNYYCKKRSWQ